MIKQIFKTMYEWAETIPDRLYPFASEIEGQWVRGRKSYLCATKYAVETYGPHRLGYKLTVYRTTFHLLGSIIFILSSAFVSQKLFGSETAFYVLIGAAIVALFIQEFYSHLKRYGQLRQKGILDWLTWVTPMVVYVFAL